MKGHTYQRFHGQTTCECGWNGKRTEHGIHVADMLAEVHAFHRDYHKRTGHCGQCGQPGSWCLCTDRDPCGCADLHPLGSGIDRDAIDVFADPTPGPDDVPMFEVGAE